MECLSVKTNSFQPHGNLLVIYCPFLPIMLNSFRVVEHTLVKAIILLWMKIKGTYLSGGVLIVYWLVQMVNNELKWFRRLHKNPPQTSQTNTHRHPGGGQSSLLSQTGMATCHGVERAQTTPTTHPVLCLTTWGSFLN